MNLNCDRQAWKLSQKVPRNWSALLSSLLQKQIIWRYGWLVILCIKVEQTISCLDFVQPTSSACFIKSLWIWGGSPCRKCGESTLNNFVSTLTLGISLIFPFFLGAFWECSFAVAKSFFQAQSWLGSHLGAPLGLGCLQQPGWEARRQLDWIQNRR